LKGEAEGLAERAVFAGKRKPVRFLIHSARFRPADGVFSGGQATAGHIIQYPIADGKRGNARFFLFSPEKSLRPYPLFFLGMPE
jgi:hypothetical protein